MSDALPSGMGGKKTSQYLDSLVPSLVNALLVFILAKQNIDPGDNTLMEAMVAFLAAAVTFPVQLLVRYLYGCYRKNRDCGKYEGRWLQVLPDRKKYPYTIFDFKYNNAEDKYEIVGYNFHRDQNVDGRAFRAYRLLARSKNDGYYYITDRTASGKIGMGKLYFDGEADGLVRAHGFFCDVDDSPEARKYETRMVKCDEAFCRKLVEDPRKARKMAKELAKMDMLQAIALCRKVADKEIDRYERTKMKKAAGEE